MSVLQKLQLFFQYFADAHQISIEVETKEAYCARRQHGFYQVPKMLLLFEPLHLCHGFVLAGENMPELEPGCVCQ
jgi:hypothetical protein